MSFRGSLPCSPAGGNTKAAGFTLFPPAAVASGIQEGCPATRSGRRNAIPPGPPPSATALNGKPVLATTTALSDQSRDTTERTPDLLAEGSINVAAPENECRTSKLEFA